MPSLSIDEMSSVLDRLDAILRESGVITLTHDGVPIARIVPLDASRAIPSLRSLREAMPRLDTPSEVLIRKDREAR